MSLRGYNDAAVREREANPRSAEYQLFSQVTNALSKVEHADRMDKEFHKALDWNRRMWSTLATDCASKGNQLPDNIRAGIISLSIWVGKHTSLVARGQETVKELIDINRTIMEGLAMIPEAAQPAPAPAQQPGSAYSAHAPQAPADNTAANIRPVNINREA